mmetsp:Transcript_13094/g.54888  ORF Transcript_13094/g.54888 Transcript_13094/m.54888 type:complete len:229 (-) Transcript_13094:1796-2482(-)
MLLCEHRGRPFLVLLLALPLLLLGQRRRRLGEVATARGRHIQASPRHAWQAAGVERFCVLRASERRSQRIVLVPLIPPGAAAAVLVRGARAWQSWARVLLGNGLCAAWVERHRRKYGRVMIRGPPSNVSPVSLVAGVVFAGKGRRRHRRRYACAAAPPTPYAVTRPGHRAIVPCLGGSAKRTRVVVAAVRQRSRRLHEQVLQHALGRCHTLLVLRGDSDGGSRLGVLV